MQHIQTFLLYSHVGLGSLAVLVGAIALIAKKGQSVHIKYGYWFAWSMVASSLIGSVMGVINYSNFLITGFAGILSVTLISSSLLTLRRKEKYTSTEIGIAAVNMLNFCAIAACGVWAMQYDDGMLFGFYAEDYFFLAIMTLVVLIGDIQYIITKHIRPNIKIARHLWRMCLGFFIAVGSAFSGPGAVAFPEPVQQSGILFVPELLIFLFMIYWFIRFRFFARR